MKKNKKTVRVTIRFSPQEHSLLMTKMDKTPFSMSEFLRKLLLDEVGKIKTTDEYELMRFMSIAMSQANNNINQIAKALNGILKSSDSSLRLGSEQQRKINELQNIITEWREFSDKLTKR